LFHRSIDTIDRFVHRLIQERRRDPAKADVLAMLMAAPKGQGLEAIGKDELRDEILNLFLAGFETSASGLTWTFMLLAQHPEMRHRVVEEAERVVGDGPVLAEHLPRLQYLGWVLSEAMRLYPPIWTNERVPVDDDTINGYAIPKGTMVAVSTWLLHHHPGLWEEPMRFDPERFAPERSEGRNRYAFVPFGLGPRTCVGNHFATMQAKVMVTTILRRAIVDVRASEVKPLAAVTLRPKGGLRGRIWMRR
ncbi:MAG: cytochrome P450, partial [Myxococcales bacterium]|nr:cytochrome P450 [Myxococcales bacterium]